MEDIEKKRNIYCNSCGAYGHDYKHCREPITSWGIILVKIDYSSEENKNNVDIKDNDGVFINNKNELMIISNYINSIKFLLVRRKHSLGFIEFLRGRYMKDNIDGIIFLFQQMTPHEISMIKIKLFDELWVELWSNDFKRMNNNKKEYLESKEKFECLKKGKNVELDLDFYIDNVKPFFNDPEWGFPKGRKLRGESDIECAIREFTEETCFNSSDIKVLVNINPIIEDIVGTNGVSYRHIYYIAEDISNKTPSMTDDNKNEIGDIGYFSHKEAETMFREYHTEKKRITKIILEYYLKIVKDKKETVKNIWVKDNDDL